MKRVIVAVMILTSYRGTEAFAKITDSSLIADARQNSQTYPVAKIIQMARRAESPETNDQIISIYINSETVFSGLPAASVIRLALQIQSVSYRQSVLEAYANNEGPTLPTATLLSLMKYNDSAEGRIRMIDRYLRQHQGSLPTSTMNMLTKLRANPIGVIPSEDILTTKSAYIDDPTLRALDEVNFAARASNRATREAVRYTYEAVSNTCEVLLRF